MNHFNEDRFHEKLFFVTFLKSFIYYFCVKLFPAIVLIEKTCKIFVLHRILRFSNCTENIFFLKLILLIL